MSSSPPSAPSGTAPPGPSALALLDHLSDMVFVVDALGTLCYANSACEAFLGRRVGDLLGSNALDLVHPDDRSLAVEALGVTAAKGPGIRESMIVRVAVKDLDPKPHHNGERAADASGEPSTRFIELVANNLLDKPDVRGIIICARDVTDRAAFAAQTEELQRRFEFSFERQPHAHAIIAPDGRFMRVNPAMIELTGYSGERLVGMHVEDLAHPEDRSMESQVTRSVLRGDTDHNTEERRLFNASGHPIWVRRTFWSVRSSDGSVKFVNYELVDITDQHTAEQRILQLRDVLESSTDLVFFTDPHGTLEYVNKRGRELLGLQEGDTPRDDLARVLTPEAVERVASALIPQVVATGIWTGELTLRTTSDEEIPVSGTVQFHYDEENEVTLVSAIVHDIRDLKDAEELLRHQATHDALTSLPNRQLFRDLGEAALARADREGTTVAVLFLDLDRFKHVNDTFGHPVGDLLLIEVAARLRDSVRRSDVVARFGGDEFAICCEHPAGQIEMLELARRVSEALSRPAQLGPVTAEVGVSIGIAIGAGTRVTIDSLLRDADVALYQAKEQGRGRSVIFGASMPVEAS